MNALPSKGGSKTEAYIPMIIRLSSVILFAVAALLLFAPQARKKNYKRAVATVKNLISDVDLGVKARFQFMNEGGKLVETSNVTFLSRSDVTSIGQEIDIRYCKSSVVNTYTVVLDNEKAVRKMVAFYVLSGIVFALCGAGLIAISFVI